MTRILLGTVLAASVVAADVPHGLTVEYRTDPVGMDAARPRLSWKVPDGGAKDVTQAAHESSYGTIRSEWRKEGGRFTWLVEVPPNTTARVILPDGLKDTVAPAGARDAGMRAGRRSWLVGSGVWRWEAVADKLH